MSLTNDLTYTVTDLVDIQSMVADELLLDYIFLGLNEPVSDLMNVFGTEFVSYISNYGYDRVLRILGHNMRDFLNGLDNLHEYMRYTYPRMRPPSFYLEKENAHGLTLHYRSRRRGFVHYVIGQITEVGRRFYDTNVQIDIVSEREEFDITHVVFELKFENTAYVHQATKDKDSNELDLAIDCFIFFELFPFHMVISESLEIISAGDSLTQLFPNIVGELIRDIFTLVRPIITLNWSQIVLHSNNVFEFSTIEPLRKQSNESDLEIHDARHQNDSEILLTMTGHRDIHEEYLRLRGQMLYVQEWKAIIYLATPVDVVGFTTICASLTPMEVVSILNEMYTKFDKCLEIHNCYKVETIGDAYMLASGVPERARNHAAEIVDMAFDMLDSIVTVTNPTNNEKLKIRIGCHSGPVVAGIAGIKMPRYCLFGDTVTTANKLEQTSKALHIHVSDSTYQLLERKIYEAQERPKMTINGAITITTYFVLNKKDRSGKVVQRPFQAVLADMKRQDAEDAKLKQSSTLKGITAKSSNQPIPKENGFIQIPQTQIITNTMPTETNVGETPVITKKNEDPTAQLMQQTLAKPTFDDDQSLKTAETLSEHNNSSKFFNRPQRSRACELL
ncbi:unnamed protein product [Rotaria sp. Silwood1]|nr:unnamed protein product [Rotaria sp. Silwood1]